MVDHDQERVKAIREREVRDQIAGDLLKGAGGGGDNGGQRRVRGVRVCFVLLASRTARNVLADEGSKTRPPKLGCDELASLENTGVTCGGMVMVSRDNGTAEGRVSGNIDSILEGQDTSVVFPVGETGAEFGREFSRECMEGVENKGVSCGGGGKPCREGGVNEVHEEDIWEEGDIFVVRI